VFIKPTGAYSRQKVIAYRVSHDYFLDMVPSWSW
jgi:hypothetical protein